MKSPIEAAAEFKKHAFEMVELYKIPGFKEKFEKAFLEEASKHPMGTVDTIALAKKIRALMPTEEK